MTVCKGALKTRKGATSVSLYLNRPCQPHGAAEVTSLELRGPRYNSAMQPTSVQALIVGQGLAPYLDTQTRVRTTSGQGPGPHLNDGWGTSTTIS